MSTRCGEDAVLETRNRLDLFERLGAAPSPEAALDSLIEDLAPPQRLGGIYAFGGRLDRPAPCRRRSGLSVVGNRRGHAWWRDYAAEPSFRLADPVRDVVRGGLAAVDWQETAKRGSGDARRRLWDPLWDQGITQGCTIPVHEPFERRYGCVTLLHFGPRAPFDRWLEANGQQITAAIYCFHGVLRATEKQAVRDPTLSPRQRECLTWVAAGCTSKQIARRLGLSPKTVDLHLAAALERLDARTRSEAVGQAIRLGLIAP